MLSQLCVVAESHSYCAFEMKGALRSTAMMQIPSTRGYGERLPIGGLTEFPFKRSI